MLSMYFVQSLVEIDPVDLEKMTFRWCQCIFAISLFSPLGKACPSSFEQN